MPHRKKSKDPRETVGFARYMEKYDREKTHLEKLEKQRTEIEAEAARLREEAENESIGYRNYMRRVQGNRKKEAKLQERIDKVEAYMNQQEQEHQQKHDWYTDPKHQHAPRKNHRGALEDGENETVVICPVEYRRLINEISSILKQSIELVQVVFHNEGIVFGNRLHRYIDHTLTSFLIRLTGLETLNNEDVTKYKMFAIHQLQYTINQINTMFWKISQIKSERPKKYKVQKDILNQWGDTKYSKEKHFNRPGLSVPPSQPFEYFVPGSGFISPYRSKKGEHGGFYEDELSQGADHAKRGLRSLDEAFYGSGEYFAKNPYIGHDHWGTLEKLSQDLDTKLEYPVE